MFIGNRKEIKDTNVLTCDVLKRYPNATHITIKHDEWAFGLKGTRRYEVHFALNGRVESLYYWVDAVTAKIVAVSEYQSGG